MKNMYKIHVKSPEKAKKGKSCPQSYPHLSTALCGRKQGETELYTNLSTLSTLWEGEKGEKERTNVLCIVIKIGFPEKNRKQPLTFKS